MKLYIANKNYSSWSMRPWVLLTEAGIPFDEVMLRFDSLSVGSRFKKEVARVSGAGRVPVLVDGDLVVWDSLAICEYVAETSPHRKLWPASRSDRARARSICAEMHSGFVALRTHCPMNIEASLPEVGEKLMREKADLRADLERLTQMWSELLRQHKGPMLFGAFSVADAYFAPAVMRLRTYSLPVDSQIAGYVARVTALSSVSAWIADALEEHAFVEFDEPYRKSAASGQVAPR